jgi:phospholipase D1/2
VFIILPLLPGFEGDVGGATGNSLRIITHWNYASICRGRNSLIQKLKDMGIRNPEDYVSFHSLRTHASLNGSLVSELIYVHSKLLIADDKTVICGSANINDRSLLGKRDSEVAVIITDESFEDGKMNGESYPCGIFAGSLRKRLFREHLGLLDHRHRHIDINDPIISSFWHGQWRAISQRNTELYDEIFRCIPNDNITTLAQIKRYQEDNPSLCRVDPEAAEKKVQEIQGFLVDLPLKFLESENLIPSGTSREGIMPTSLWI